jgi:hypothetical protein
MNNMSDPTEAEEELFLKKVKRIFEENYILNMQELLIQLGVPKEIAYSKDPDLIFKHQPLMKGSDSYYEFLTYSLAITNRYSLKSDPLRIIDPSEYNLNVHDNEIVYHRINNTSIFEERITRRHIAYSGLRWSNGLLRAGTLTLTSDDIYKFTILDIGALFITNERIIFLGKQRNLTKAIPINSILTYSLYQDGILISQANKKGILFKFEQYNVPEVLQDGLNEFIIVLNRIIEGTEKVNLETEARTDLSETDTICGLSNSASELDSLSDEERIKALQEEMKEIHKKIDRIREIRVAVEEDLKSIKDQDK